MSENKQKQIILGTAGHIDHGKTSLIKALTGVDTDRLKEEKLRGITIELGFASLDLSRKIHLSIVDVPGHEKFIKNMVAGASGIDIVVLVIAADEGIMPQTKEHLEICSLLDIKYGLIALTKIDMVDEDWLELVQDDITNYIKGTFLENCEIVKVSSKTNQGLDDLICALDEKAQKIPEKTFSQVFRLPVDRVFTMKGFGTVVTGSVISGQVKVNDTISIYPSKEASKVRGLQAHNDMVDTANSGMRLAINFQGLDKTEVVRGDVIASYNTLAPTYMLDVKFNYSQSLKKPLKNRSRIRFHIGTSEIIGIIVLLDKDEVLPGDDAYLQIRLDAPVVAIKDDRFVIRSYSPIHTIGGGVILNPLPQKHKQHNADVIKGLEILSKDDDSKIVSYLILNSDFFGISLKNLIVMANLSEKKLKTILQKLLSIKEIIQIDKENLIYIHSKSLDKIKTKILNFLKSYHSKFSLKPGMPKEELKSKFPETIYNPKLFNIAFANMTENKDIICDEDIVRLFAHKVSLKIDEQDIKNKILDIYINSGFMPPYFKDVCENNKIDQKQGAQILSVLVDEGKIIKVKNDLFYHVDEINKLKDQVINFLNQNHTIALAQFKELTKASRKYMVPLLEYFDSCNLTIRVGDVRKLRKTK